MLRHTISCVLFFIIFTPSSAKSQLTDSIRPEQVCTHPTRFVGPCGTIRGRLGYANGGIPVRMWKVGTNRMLGVEDETYGTPFCVLPPAVRELLNADKFVFADFVVRPLTVEEPGVMQRVCVASATNIRTEPAYFLHPPPAARPSNMRLKLPGALVLREAVVSCAAGHGTSSSSSSAGGRVARSLSAIR